jgi:CheY-like chemotaxis protein
MTALHETVSTLIHAKKQVAAETSLSVERSDVLSSPSQLLPEIASVRSDVTQKPMAQQVDILAAEDNETNRMFLDYVLNDLGFSFQIVNDGAEAVQAFKELRPKLMLMDISMPIKNGHEATLDIRAFERERGLEHTPIIAVTAHAMSGDREKCLSVGMNDFVAKPISIQSLTNVLSQYGLVNGASSSRKAG